MNSKNNRVNHDFQIAYFLAGSCHTPDAAYALLCDLRDDRAMALEASNGRSWWRFWRKPGPVAADVQARCIAAAKAELDTINKCIDRLQPLRKYSNLTDAEAHEACQAEEWKLELIFRAENFLLNGGVIPADHFAAMRQHPAFKDEILPAIEGMKLGNGYYISTRSFDPQLLLEHHHD